MTQVYLDYSATAPVREEVLRAIWPVLTDTFGNPSSQHTPGFEARERLNWARESVATTLGCSPEELVFTSGGTESDNLAIIGAALANPRGRHIVVSAVEHPAVLESAAYLQRHHGFRVSTVPVDAFGVIDVDALAEELTEHTTLCSVMMANNEVGTVQPIAAIIELCADLGVPIHTDAVQVPGWLDLRVDSLLGLSAMTLSGHKMGATKGVGLLYRNAQLRLEPTVVGGGQQSGLRSGTQDVAGPIGFAVALALAVNERKAALNRALVEAVDSPGQTAGQAAESVADPVAIARDALIQRVLEEIPDAELTGHPVDRLPGHASFVFPRVNGETLLLELDRMGYACSSGSACAAGSQEPSPVLVAMGVAPQVAHTAVRLSFNRGTSHENLTAAAEALSAAHKKIAR
jgi:cysteine desulfurase